VSLQNPGRNVRRPITEAVYLLIVLVGFGVVALRLYTVQIKQGAEFAKRSRDNFVQTKRLQHDRGEIVDREGRLLATNRSSFDVTITPAFLPRPEVLIERLGRALGLGRPATEPVARGFKTSSRDAGRPVLLARALTARDVHALRAAQRELDLPLEAVAVIAEPEPEPDAPRYAAYLDPAVFPSVPRVLREVARLCGLEEAEHARLRARIGAVTGLSRYRDVLVRGDVPPGVAESVGLQVELGDLPGVQVREARARAYPRGRTVAHLLGYVNELSPEELEQRRDLGYRLGDQIGRRGVEQAFEDELRGVDGFEPVVVDSKGRVQSSGLALELRDEAGASEPPKAGSRVVLTVDLDLQRVAETVFPGRAGAVVVIEVHTGRLLAITSTPTFDPAMVSGTFDPAERARLHAIQDLRPWRFRAIQDHYAPGSTFKVVTALAALNAHATTPHETIGCPGVFRLGDTRFRCWRAAGHGKVDMPLSLAQSCDVYYYTLGARIGLDAIAATGAAFGFGRRSGIPIQGEGTGIMPNEAWYVRQHGFYTKGAAVNASIGQGAVAVTPLQLAVAYAALGNGGQVLQPQVAMRVEAYDGDAVRSFEPKPVRRLELSSEDRAVLVDGLTRVVNDPRGTAYRRRLKELKVSGKTGTAQVAKLGLKREKTEDMAYLTRDHAWFAAFAPAEAPEIAVVVLNEHGGHGGSDAAPTAMAVIQAWWDKKQGRAAAPGDRPLEILAAASGEGEGDLWPPVD
jgi:penicillin-binding protein 2